MLSTSTHDAKRGEDVRARLAVLSELPEAWPAAVRRWAAMNDHRRCRGMPDRNTEYLLYQTLVGAWPISTERVVAYMEKAVREAKAHTSWISPDTRYERALRDFVVGTIEDPAFRRSLEEFLPPVVAAGMVNSMAMKLLCLTAPGVPDLYQGAELWALTLVDPDNRRPVDFTLRRRLLEELDAAGPEAPALAWSRRDEGLPKLLVVSRALRLRRERPELFAGAAYEPLRVAGAAAASVLAFCRGGGAVTVVPRLTLDLAGGWHDTAVELPPGRWLDRFTGTERGSGAVPVAALLDGFPVALLERREP